MDTEPQTAKAMLLDLNQYLRTTLRQTREDDSTLGREVDVMVAYLKIFRIRMGERLQFTVDLPESLKHKAFPPMLLQPLVENAVIHGIEPAEESGRIDIRVQHPPGALRVQISDTGVGFADNAGDGVGLANVRKRLGLLFGSRSRLIVKANRPHGVMVIVEIADEETH